MKLYLKHLLLILLLVSSGKASAQQIFTISGRVTDSLGVPQKAATVFISGTTRITISDDQGGFAFDRMTPGTFQLSVSMVGFNPYAHNVVIQSGSVKVDVVLKTKSVILREVMIGLDRRAENLRLFKMAFLGVTDNAKQCVLLNPDAVNFNFSKKKGILTADADEFLLIENKRLGYRIKYLLKDFSYNLNLGVALYDGETNFEDLPGTQKMKNTWAKNRLDAYNGSMMHFLRSVYRHNTAEEGFDTHNVFREGLSRGNGNDGKLIIEEKPLAWDNFLSRVDTSVLTMKFKVLYIDYTGSKKPKLQSTESGLPGKVIISASKHSSVLTLVAPQAIIDARGSYSDYRTFYHHGFMADRRVGDQLPFEYQPPAK